MRWTYQEYMSQPIWLLECIGILNRAETNESKHKSKLKNGNF